MISIKLVDDAGRARFFQFKTREVRVAFRPGADVVLEPFSTGAGELCFRRQDDGTYVAVPVGTPGRFSVFGTVISTQVPLQKGTVISAGTWHVHVEGIDASADDEFEDYPEGHGATAGSQASQSNAHAPVSHKTLPPTYPPRPEAGHGAASPLRPDNAAHLVLFFEPVRQFFEDDDVSEIMINGPSDIYVERKGRLERIPAKFINEQALQAAVKNVARSVGRLFTAENPRLDARFPDGSRLHAVMPPLSRAGTVVAIRKFRKEKLTMAQLTKFGSISEEGAGLLEAIVKMHRNVIVSGPTSSGKTSVLNVLSGFIDPGERILVIEDASELQLQQKHAVYFETRKPDEHDKGEVTIRDLLASCLRLRPDRLIVGEIRGGESLDMLQAMNTGHSGSMSTIHANSPTDALSRIETCALLSGVDIPLAAVRRQVVAAIHVIVHTVRMSDGARRITNISEVCPLKDGEYVTRDLIAYSTSGMGADGKLVGGHHGTGVKPGFFGEAVLRGIKIEESWFRGPGV